MMHLTNRLPAVAEVLPFHRPPMCETYWWFSGMNFNRPQICCVEITSHVTEGTSVRVRFMEETPVAGFDAAHFAGREFVMDGPIALP